MSQGETYSSVLTAECKMRIARLTTTSKSDDSIDDPFQASSGDEYNLSCEDFSSSSSNSNSTIDDEELDNNRNNEGKKRGRKPNNWSVKKAKFLRNSGKSYVSQAKSGKSFEERKMGQPCKGTCRMRCIDQISEADRQQLFNNYWSLGDLQRQREYIAGHMEPILPKYRYSCTGNFRKHNNAFYFSVNVNKIRVCKLFFMSTLGISDRYIRTTLSKKNSNGFVDPDLRGKHNNHPTVDPAIKNSVREFIKAIPRVESHYLRNQSSREFIEGSKCIADLYRDYKELRINDNLPFAHSSMFNQIFNTEFNISFFKPKKDQCDFCETYRNSNDRQKLDMYEAHTSHQEEKELSRKEKEEDKKKSHVAVYDLQAVLPLPKGLTSSFYYKNKINCYNFTISDLHARNVECFFWSEIEGNRGSFEIGSCVLRYIEIEMQKASNPEDVEFIFYSDNCAGQQKNKYLVSMYCYAVQKYRMKSITHKFLITGHSQNEGDNVHSVIEKQIKRHVTCIPIYIPEQYISLIATAKKTGRPYKLHQMSHSDFYDLKTLQEEWGNNFSTNVHKEKFLWKDIKILRVEKNSPESFYYKTSYKDSSFSEVKVRNITTKSLKSWDLISLTKAYSSIFTLPERKQKDLFDLIRKNVIPNQYYEAYYKHVIN